MWWTPDGKLRADAGSDKCPGNPSEITPDDGVRELRGTAWTQVDPAGTYRDFPVANGDVVVKTNASTDTHQPDQTSNGTGPFIRTGGHLVHVADLKAGAGTVAGTPPHLGDVSLLVVSELSAP